MEKWLWKEHSLHAPAVTPCAHASLLSSLCSNISLNLDGMAHCETVALSVVAFAFAYTSFLCPICIMPVAPFGSLRPPCA